MDIYGDTWNLPIEKITNYYKSLEDKTQFKQLEKIFN